jgi:hypothetical protein
MKTLRKIAVTMAVTMLAATLGIDQAAAAPATTVNPLAPYIGQCVGMITTAPDVGMVPGVLRAADQDHVEMELLGSGWPTFVFMPHVSVALVATSESCVTEGGVSMKEMLESIASEGRQ